MKTIIRRLAQMMESDLIMKNRTGTCSEYVFWDCISEICWPIENTDLAKAKILRSWTPEFCQSFRAIANEKVLIVSRAARSEMDADDWIGDDGFGDLCWHVVGLGKPIFEDEVSNPGKLSERIRNGDFRESLDYVIPHAPSTSRSLEEWAKVMGMDLGNPNTERMWMQSVKGDWVMMEPSHYSKWAKELLPNVSAFVGDLERPSTDCEAAAIRHSCELVHYFNLLIHEKTVEAVCHSENAMRAWWSLYYIAERVRGLKKSHVNLLSMANSMYSGENLINDHRQFMGGLSGFPFQKHLKEIDGVEHLLDGMLDRVTSVKL